MPPRRIVSSISACRAAAVVFHAIPDTAKAANASMVRIQVPPVTVPPVVSVWTSLAPSPWVPVITRPPTCSTGTILFG